MYSKASKNADFNDSEEILEMIKKIGSLQATNREGVLAAMFCEALHQLGYCDVVPMLTEVPADSDRHHFIVDVRAVNLRKCLSPSFSLMILRYPFFSFFCIWRCRELLQPS